MLYRVHKHILGLHCSVLGSLFDGLQAAFDVESKHHDDLPDAAEDVRDFLRALYFPKETQRHSHLNTPVRDGRWNIFPDFYYGILRLAVKYDAAEIRDLLVPLLRADWPAVFEDWHRLQETLTASGPIEEYIEKRVLRSSHIISLAETCNIPDVLSVAV
ncbi:hypothetical protein BV25DRAFT_1922020 [Artomyces pyxidatus]|uniref:Uncharacterized protein n=1 Tax=Artomyces pyxidatus TaxID=48021 RepID=A0ACB8SGM3_9AGAM|nr:hypothetical protein BV25DRAFT_1922020 [Artomyces pyxidatus]